MLINLSNHPYKQWGEAQKQAAALYGKVKDIKFPKISPKANEQAINTLAHKYLERILQYVGNEQIVVHVMGEMTFTFNLVTKLEALDILCIASTSERIVTESEPGKKFVEFEFVQFRLYL